MEGVGVEDVVIHNEDSDIWIVKVSVRRRLIVSFYSSVEDELWL